MCSNGFLLIYGFRGYMKVACSIVFTGAVDVIVLMGNFVYIGVIGFDFMCFVIGFNEYFIGYIDVGYGYFDNLFEVFLKNANN